MSDIIIHDNGALMLILFFGMIQKAQKQVELIKTVSKELLNFSLRQESKAMYFLDLELELVGVQ